LCSHFAEIDVDALAESQLDVRAFVGGSEVDLPVGLPPDKSMTQFLGEALAVARRYHTPELHDVGLRLVQVPRRGHVGGRARPAAKRSTSRSTSRDDPDDLGEPPGDRPPLHEGASA
jgi:hypothetical protein